MQSRLAKKNKKKQTKRLYIKMTLMWQRFMGNGILTVYYQTNKQTNK